MNNKNPINSKTQIIPNEIKNQIENQFQNGTPTTELSVENVSNIMASTAGSNNNRRKPSVCDICNKVFSRYDNLERHRRIHEGQKLFKCNVCGKSFAQSSYLKVHYRTHNGERPFKCNVCGYAFSRSDHLIRHMRTHHSNRQAATTYESRKPFDNLSSPRLVSSFSSVQKLTSQQPKDTTNQPSNESPDEDNDDDDNQHHHQVNHEHHHHHHHQADHEDHHHHHHERLSCGHQHLLYRTIADKHACCLSKSSEAGKAAKRGSDSGTGISEACQSSNQVNAPQASTPELTFLNCDVCWKAFSQAPHESLHNSIPASGLPYQCQICQKSFSRKDNLKRHISTHDGAKLFSCEVCSKAFSRRAYLKVHNRIHSGERPYKCTICDYGFTRSDHLIRHNRPNKGERKFSCMPADLKDDRESFRTNGTHQPNFSSPSLQVTAAQNQNSTLAITSSASEAPAHHTMHPSSPVSLTPAQPTIHHVGQSARSFLIPTGHQPTP